ELAELEDGDHFFESSTNLVIVPSARVFQLTQLQNHPTKILHALIAMPYTLFDASSMASARVGCAWIVHMRSSTVASSSIAVTASAINSVACGPIMWTPRISP